MTEKFFVNSMQGLPYSPIYSIHLHHKASNKTTIKQTMKHLRFILPVVLCCVVAGLMTSCLNDNNDDNGLSKEEQLQAFQTVRGNYSGDVIFYKNTYDGMSTPTKKDIDTLKASFSLLTDSTAHINNLPLAALANQIKDSKVAEAVMNGTVTTTPVNLYTYYYVVSPATCLVGADYVEVKATYDGEEHTIRFGFYSGITTGTTVSFGIYSSTAGIFQIGLRLGAVWVDGTDKSSSLLFSDQVHGIIILNGKRF